MPKSRYEMIYQKYECDIAKLSLAIVFNDIPYITEVLALGQVNPFETPTLITPTKIDPFNTQLTVKNCTYFSPFMVAILLCDLKNLKAILNSDIGQEAPIDLSTMVNAEFSDMNWLQFIAIFSSPSAIIEADNYYKEHFPHPCPDFVKLINQQFTFEMPNPATGKIKKVHTTVPGVLLYKLSTDVLINNYSFIDDDTLQNREFISKWRDKTSVIDKHPTPPFDTSRIYFGPIFNLKFLIKKGLDLITPDHTRRTLDHALRFIIDAYKNPDLFESELRKTMLLNRNVKFTSSARKGKSNLTEIDIEVCNLLNENPIKLTYFAYPNLLQEIVNDVENMNKATYQNMQLQIDEINQKMQVMQKQISNISHICEKMARTSEMQYNSICEQLNKYAFYSNIFTGLHVRTEAYIRARQQANFRLYKCAPASNEAKVALAAVNALTIVGNACQLPFLNIGTGLFEAFVSYGVANQNAAIDYSVISLTKNAHISATIISTQIIDSLMRHYGKKAHSDAKKEQELINNLFNIVKKQINNLYKHEFASSGQAIAHICINTWNEANDTLFNKKAAKLSPAKSIVSSASSVSTSSPVLAKRNLFLAQNVAGRSEYPTLTDLSIQSSQDSQHTQSSKSSKNSTGCCLVM